MKSFRNSKLAAFTLVEVLVVITISCFFVAMVYASVRFLIVSALSDKLSQQSEGAIWALEGSLLHETEAARLLTCSASDSLLVCIMPYRDTISYHFHRRYLIRLQGNREDTIAAVCNHLLFRFGKRPVESGIIDHIELKTLYMQKTLFLQFEKKYTPEQRFTLIDTLNFTAP